MKELTETDKAYLAALIDEYGRFFITKVYTKRTEQFPSHIFYRCRLDYTSDNTIIMEWLKDKFGGSFHIIKQTYLSSNHEKVRTIYTWTTSAKNLLKVCEDILRYLIIKKRTCQLIIDFRKTFENSHPRSSEEKIEERSQYYIKLKELKEVEQRVFNRFVRPRENVIKKRERTIELCQK